MSRAATDVLTGPRSPIAAPAADRVVAAAKSARWLSLDVFRFFAVLMMVQGHTFTQLLDSVTKDQSWYPHHSAFHGFTAPMFLFGAGLAFGYTTFKKWDAHAAGGAAPAKRYKRYLWLLVLGYGLQLPTLSMTGLLSMENPTRIARFFQVNVLQHIGVSLAIAQILVRVLKRRRLFVGVIGALALFCVFAAPWIWALDVSSLPVFLRGYINKAEFSYFPIVPWAGFTYAGILIAYLVGLGDSAKSISRRAAVPFLALALAFMLIPIAIDRLGGLPWPPHNFWKTNPLFFFWRLGNVLLVLSLLCFVERWMRQRGWLDAPSDGGNRLAAAMLPWVKLIAAESLVIYVAHLLVLHGSVLAPGITRTDLVTSHGHGVLVATGVTVALLLVMVLVSKLWSELRKQKTAYQIVQAVMIGGILLLSLTR